MPAKSMVIASVVVAGGALIGGAWLLGWFGSPAGDRAGGRSDSERSGWSLYASCIACHGNRGQGVATMGPPLNGSAVVHGNVADLVQRIRFGSSQHPAYRMSMPPFAGSEAELSELIAFLRSTMTPPATSAHNAGFLEGCEG